MAVYRRVDDTCGLTACTPGSAPGPTLGNEYGKPLPFLLVYCDALKYGTQQTTKCIQKRIDKSVKNLHWWHWMRWNSRKVTDFAEFHVWVSRFSRKTDNFAENVTVMKWWITSFRNHYYYTQNYYYSTIIYYYWIGRTNSSLQHVLEFGYYYLQYPTRLTYQRLCVYFGHFVLWSCRS